LSRIPEEVVRRDPDRPYAAFVEVEPSENRKFVLFEKERIFGRGNGFSENAHGIGYSALKFTRTYVYLKMSSGKEQRVVYLNTASDAGVTLLGDEEVLLQLNGIYEIYLGDFRITLNLRASASTSRASV
jgi:hypothetical protein